jgi:hypothetical protein
MNFIHGVSHFMLKKKHPSSEPAIGSDSDGVMG